MAKLQTPRLVLIWHGDLQQPADIYAVVVLSHSATAPPELKGIEVHLCCDKDACAVQAESQAKRTDGIHRVYPCHVMTAASSGVFMRPYYVKEVLAGELQYLDLYDNWVHAAIAKELVRIQGESRKCDKCGSTLSLA